MKIEVVKLPSCGGAWKLPSEKGGNFEKVPGRLSERIPFA
jgi:hypothetical protein